MQEKIREIIFIFYFKRFLELLVYMKRMISLVVDIWLVSKGWHLGWLPFFQRQQIHVFFFYFYISLV